MIRSRALLGTVGVLMLGQACGGTPPPAVVKPPPLVITAAPPPPPVRAKWVFTDHSRAMSAKLDLGKDTGVLYVGAHGRRTLIKGDAEPVDASTLAFDDLVGVLKDDKGQLVFVADDGDVFVAKDALGAIDTTRPSPLADVKGATLRSPTTGKSSIMGIASNDNRLMRTTDFGVSWKQVDYAGATKPWGKPVSVALDGQGNGILIHLPQRVFVTHDDGATWAPIASPGIGARRAMRDGNGKIFVDGFNYQRAKLDGNALAITTDTPEPVFNPQKKDKPDAPTPDEYENDSVQLIAGDHQVELASVYRHGKTREIRIRNAKLGEKADKPIANTDLISRDGLSRHVASYNGSLIYLRADDDSDQNTPTSTVFFSNDFGATWTKDVTVEGAEPQSDSTAVALGPKGWAFIGALCTYGESYGEGDGDDESEHYGNGGAENCNARKVRPAGQKTFEDMAFTEDFTPSSFTFDEAHDKVYAIGTSTKDNETRIYESALSQNKWVRTKIDIAGMDVGSLSVDAKGVLRAFAYSYSEGWTIVRPDADGKTTKEYLTLDGGDLTFVGQRGLLLSGHNKGWETADGGETWVRIATNGSREADCSDAGCRSGDAVRIGWDLPAAAKDQTFTASTEKPAKPAKVDAPPPAFGAPTPTMELACKVSGAAVVTPDQRPSFDTADNRADVRWAMVSNEGSRNNLVVGGKSGTRDILLVAGEKPVVKGQKPDPIEHRSGTRTLAEGVVGARYSFQSKSSTGTYNPVDIELTWFSYVSGKVGHHTIAKHPAFRVASYGFTGDAQIVAGGLLYQATDGEPATFIHDDGKTEPLPLPSRASVRSALHVGTRWLLGDAESGTMQLSASDDNGKTWKTKAWTLEDSYSSLALVALGGKPIISLPRNSVPAVLFPVDAAIPDDPPNPTIVDFDASIANACDASAGPLRQSQYLNNAQRKLTAKIDDGKKGSSQYTVAYRMAHGLGTGKACTSAYKLSGNGDDLFLYADGATWTGWRFHRDESDPKKTKPTAEPVTCTAPK